MCQILCLTSHDPAKRDQIILDAWHQMSITQKDGYGAAWFGADGTIGFHKRRFPRLVDTIETPKFVDSKKGKTTPFSLSNDIPSDGGFLIIHGRASTNDISLANTHPMLAENAAMVHNGVIRSFKYSNKNVGCTCDSEKLLLAYLDGGADNVELHTDGSYAFMMLKYEPPTDDEIVLAASEDRLPAGKKSLHIAKDNVRTLHSGVMHDGTYAIGTTEFLLEKVNAEYHGEFLNYTLLIFSSATEYQMTEYKGLAYAQKNVFKSATPIGQATWRNNHEYDYDHEGDERFYPAKSSSTLPAESQRALTTIEEAYDAAEQLEIIRMERAPIAMV